MHNDPTTAPHRWWALVFLALGLAMIVLDGSIVSVALPDIIRELALDLTDAQWVTGLYSVVFSALLLTAGQLGDRWGRRKIMLAGVAVFMLGSVVAYFAPTGGALILGRLIQGVGGAGVLPGTLSTVNATFRGKDRAAAFGVWGAVMSGAAAVGPLLGGWLAGTFDWRWIFMINVPLGLVVIAGALAVVPETRSHTRPTADPLGTVLSAAALGLIVLAVIESSSVGWWHVRNPLVIGSFELGQGWAVSPVPVLLALGIVLFAVFLAQQSHRMKTSRTPLLDLRLFGHRTFSWGNLTAGTVAVGEFGLLFVLPLYLSGVLGLSVMETGFVLATMAVGAFVAGAMARHIAARIGAGGTVITGLSLELVGVAVLALLLPHNASGPMVALVLVIYGVGLGLASAQLTSTVLAQVPPEQSGQGSATQSTVRQVGTALGTAVAGALLGAGITAGIDGLPAPAARFGQALHDSAGSVLRGLREQGAPGDVVEPLAHLFTQATLWPLWGSVAFLLLGWCGAVITARAARSVRMVSAEETTAAR